MRAGIRRDLCESNAVCVALAPDVFDLDSDGIAFPFTTGPLEGGQADAVESAVLGCPRLAVLLLEDD